MRLDVVLGFEAVLGHLELQLTHGRKDRLAVHVAGRVEDLDRALLGELRDALLERLVAAGIDVAHAREMFGLERRNAVVAQRGTVAQRVADRERARVGQAHHVARERFFHHLAIAREEFHRAGETHFLARAHVAHQHVALEAAAADAQKGHPVAVARIHVGLDLEHEARELIRFRIDGRGFGRARARGQAGPRRGRHIQERVEEKLHAEIGHRAAEEHGRGIAAQHRVAIEAFARALEQLEAVDEFAIGILVAERGDRRIAHVGHAHGRALGAVLGALEEMHLVRAAIVDAAKSGTAADRPDHRIGADAEHVFEFVEEFERIAAGAVHLVDEREERNAPRAADGEELFGLRLHAFGRIEQHDRAIGGEQRAIRVFAEILVTRRVEQVHRVLAIGKLQHGRGDRDAALALEFHPVGGGLTRAAACRHLAGGRNRAAVEQQLFGERGLARVGMRDDRERAPALDFFDDVFVSVVVHPKRSSGSGRRNPAIDAQIARISGRA